MGVTARERVMATLKREEPDRVPCCELAVDHSLGKKLAGWGQQKNMAVIPISSTDI